MKKRGKGVRRSDTGPRARMLAAMLGGAATLGACAAGPDYVAPVAPDVAAYTMLASDRSAASAQAEFAKSQTLTRADVVDPQWWRQLGSPALDAFIDVAMQASPTLAAAQATLRQAQETFDAQNGATSYPQVQAVAGMQRQRANVSQSGKAGEPQAVTLHSATLGISYELDVAGGNRRRLEALAARTEHRRFQLHDAQLALAANIATSALTRARLAGQLRALDTIVQAQAQQMSIAEHRYRYGQASHNDVLALRSDLEQTRAAIPLLRNQMQQAEHLLAVLAGRAPGAMLPPPFALQDFVLPAELPVIVPSELVRARPDIQAAEALLVAANADYGVALSRLYPQINLSASMGWQALTTGALFGGGSLLWGLAGQVAQPLFAPGLPAQTRAALAGFDVAAANYQSVVLNGLRDVADVLRSLENNAQRLVSLRAADVAAQASLEVLQRQYGLGAVSYLEVLTASRQAQNVRFELIAGQAQRLVDTVALFRAMGGGRLSTGPMTARTGV
ncbi:MAG TPA: efflux transporter outer membrane subunit [Candidimonas sp.]|nr:efflux transporter outer membrane subunit [Candidimonas sp.]